MKKIVFATNNLHKLEEIRQILGSSMEVVSLADIGCHADIPETADTLEGNALQKAQYVWDHYHMSVFSDDTGLEVDALDGAPGVHSARYAEDTDHNSEANMEKLLRELNGKTSRTAHFRTVIALLLAEDGNEAEAAKDSAPLLKTYQESQRSQTYPVYLASSGNSSSSFIARVPFSA